MKLINLNSSRPFFKKPKITSWRMIQGKKFYVGLDGKLYEASLMDNFFGIERPRVKVSKKHVYVTNTFTR